MRAVCPACGISVTKVKIDYTSTCENETSSFGQENSRCIACVRTVGLPCNSCCAVRRGYINNNVFMIDAGNETVMEIDFTLLKFSEAKICLLVAGSILV